MRLQQTYRDVLSDGEGTIFTEHMWHVQSEIFKGQLQDDGSRKKVCLYCWTGWTCGYKVMWLMMVRASLSCGRQEGGTHFSREKNDTSLPSFHLRLISVTAPPPFLLRLFAVSVGACVRPHCLAPRWHLNLAAGSSHVSWWKQLLAQGSILLLRSANLSAGTAPGPVVGMWLICCGQSGVFFFFSREKHHQRQRWLSWGGAVHVAATSH